MDVLLLLLQLGVKTQEFHDPDKDQRLKGPIPKTLVTLYGLLSGKLGMSLW